MRRVLLQKRTRKGLGSRSRPHFSGRLLGIASHKLGTGSAHEDEVVTIRGVIAAIDLRDHRTFDGENVLEYQTPDR